MNGFHRVFLAAALLVSSISAATLAHAINRMTAQIRERLEAGL